MVTKRIKVRSGNGNAKVLRFDETMLFDALIHKIVGKLEVTFDCNLTLEEQFDLWLCDGGDGSGHLLEGTDEIDDGDQVLLKKKKKRRSTTPPGEYSAVLPVTSDGLQIVIRGPFPGGLTATAFFEYAKSPDGTQGPAEVNKLIRQKGDRIIAVNGVSTIGMPFPQVKAMLKKQVEAQNKVVHLRLLDVRYTRIPGVQKRQAEDKSNKGNDSDNDVEDVTEQCLEQRRSARVKQEKNAELVTSGDENDDGESSVEKEGTGRKRKATVDPVTNEADK